MDKSFLSAVLLLVIDNRRKEVDEPSRGADFPSYVLPATSMLPGLLDISREGILRKAFFNSGDPGAEGPGGLSTHKFVSTQEGAPE